MNKLREQITPGQNKEKNSLYLFWMHQNYKVRKMAWQFRDTTAVRQKKTSKTTQVATVPDQACRFQSHMTAHHASQYRHHIVPTNIGNSPHVPLGLQPLPPPAKDGTNVTLASQRQRENKNRSGRSRGADRNPCHFHLGSEEQVLLDRRSMQQHTQGRERWREVKRKREVGGDRGGAI